MLEQVLESLKPKVDEQVNALHGEIEKLKATNERMSISINQMGTELTQQRIQNRTLQDQLLATKAELGQAQGQLGVASEQRQKEGDKQKLFDAQHAEMLEKIRSLKEKMQGEQANPPEFARDRLKLEQILTAYVGMEREAPSTQPSK